MAVCKGIPVCHVLAVVLGSMEIVLFAGVVFGWHSIVYIYKDVGYFSEGCAAPKPGYNQQNWNISFLNKPLAYTNSTKVFMNNDTYSIPVSTVSSAPANVSATMKSSEKESSVRFDQLTCEEQMAIRAEEGGTSRVCDSQDDQFFLVFSLATGINGILSFPSGLLYDRLGTRISRIISLVCFLGGQFFLIFASPEMPWLLYPGFTGLVYGGYQILLTNLQLSGLIPHLRSTIMSLYSGSYDTSSAIFLLFKAAHEGGVSVNTSFAVQASLYFLIFASSTFFLLPKTRIPNPLPPGFRMRSYLCQKFCETGEQKSVQTFTSQEWQVDCTGSIILVQGPEPSENFRNSLTDPEVDRSLVVSDSAVKKTEESQADDVEEDQLIAQNGARAKTELKEAADFIKHDTVIENGVDSETAATQNKKMLERATSMDRKTFRQVALSPLFLTDLMWMSFQRLRSWIFVGMFNPWITRLACGDKQLVSHYTSVYAGLQFFGILTAPLSGRLMDRKIKGAEKYGNPRYERLHAAIASFVLNSSVSVVLTIGTLIPVLEIQYATFVLHCLHRSFLYGPNSAFVANAFPNEHFGKLFGVTLTVSAVFSCLQYPLFLIMQGPLAGNPFYINIFLLVLMLISFIHPIYIWRFLQKKAAKRSL